MLPSAHLVWGSGKFLGYMVTHRMIEVNPDQIKAINNLQSPWNPKEVQKLTGMASALNRFISQSAEKCRPFFLLINKKKGLHRSADREMNLFKAAVIPVSFYTFLGFQGDCKLLIALIWSGLTSIPL